MTASIKGRNYLLEGPLAKVLLLTPGHSVAM